MLHFLTRAWWQKILPENQNVIKTNLAKEYWEGKYQMGVEQLSRTQGLAKHVEKQREWKLPHVSESEGLAVLGSYSVAQGAIYMYYLSYPILENKDDLPADIYSSNCHFHATTNLQESSTATIFI